MLHGIVGWSHLLDLVLADALSHVTLKLDAVTVKSILGRVTVGMTERGDVHPLAVADANEEIHKQVQETAILARTTHMHVDLHVTNWVTTQQEDLYSTCD